MGLRRTFVLVLLAVPFVASALTLEEIQQRLQGLLQRVSVLKQELQVRETQKPPLPSNLPCLSLGRTLRAGMEGQDVKKLQDFLIGAGELAKGNATGYFGPLTEAAVQKWQTAASIVSSGKPASTGFGIVGPKTRKAILTACKNRIVESRAAPVRSCPAEGGVPSSACATTWQKGYDAGGCSTGYVCVENQSPSPVLPLVASSSIALLEPLAGSIVTGGSTLTISWRSQNIQAGSVSISLIDATGKEIGEIARGLSHSGVYRWKIPAESSCADGESASYCIEKFSLCEGNSSICSLPPGTYLVRVILGVEVRDSETFQIAGTAASGLPKTFVGAPVASSSQNASSGASAASSACIHEGQPYEEGATLSVQCVSGNCPSSGTGYITGACTKGRWCIPETTYCASVLTAIDVKAYEGGGAAPIGSGYNVSCPQEGWRVYLSCPYGGCTTGWNVCRGGSWVLDSTQQTVIVGMQGPCESGKVWCGIGYGFGCVVANQCVNGKAL
ncbi:peptidoglycan-binding protein [Candidatus Kaiserbacteria bacterium]|nr:peptidoglycan-binding protein [Candidatus Kaiserbacteria bacterium]